MHVQYFASFHIRSLALERCGASYFGSHAPSRSSPIEQRRLRTSVIKIPRCRSTRSTVIYFLIAVILHSMACIWLQKKVQFYSR